MVSISIVIPVRNRWDELTGCLDALERQEGCAASEIILIDDGSTVPPPQSFVERISSSKIPIRMKRQIPLGIAAARNHGVLQATGEVVLFVDSDTRPEGNCLLELTASVEAHPEDVAFQLRIVSETRTQVGRMDALTLGALQKSLLTADGHILYADTAGFALRRAFFREHEVPFDVGAARGEDTLLMVKLYRRGKIPRFVPGARVRHEHTMPVFKYLRKHFWIGYRAARADRLAKHLVAEQREPGSRKGAIYREMRAEAGADRATFALVMAAYCFKLVGRGFYRVFGLKSRRTNVLHAPVNAVNSTAELIARLVQAAERGTGIAATYLTSWTLVRSERDLRFRTLLSDFEICFADGIGVVYTLMLTKGTRIKKITANDFYEAFFHEIANRNLKVALVGSHEGITNQVASGMKEKFPALDAAHEQRVAVELRDAEPHIVVIGRGQPVQEIWVEKLRAMMPNTVFLCVGGLFDYIVGVVHPTPTWVRRAGFEWLYRVAHHPSRYWHMYLLGIPALIFYLIRYYGALLIRKATPAPRTPRFAMDDSTELESDFAHVSPRKVA